MFDEDAQLHPPRFVQTQALSDGVDLLCRGVQAAQNFSRVTAKNFEKQKHQEHHANQCGDHLPKAADEVSGHGLRAPQGEEGASVGACPGRAVAGFPAEPGAAVRGFLAMRKSASRA